MLLLLHLNKWRRIRHSELIVWTSEFDSKDHNVSVCVCVVGKLAIQTREEETSLRSSGQSENPFQRSFPIGGEPPNVILPGSQIQLIEYSTWWQDYTQSVTPP